MVADLIGLEDQAARVAGHAGDAVDDGASVPLLGVFNDVGGAAVDALAVAVDEHVTVQAVRQAEDDLAAVGPEGVLRRLWPQGVFEEDFAIVAAAFGGGE